jgi:hypothetical protein
MSAFRIWLLSISPSRVKLVFSVATVHEHNSAVSVKNMIKIKKLVLEKLLQIIFELHLKKFSADWAKFRTETGWWDLANIIDNDCFGKKKDL